MSGLVCRAPRESFLRNGMMIRALAPEMSGIARPEACSVMWPTYATLKSEISGGSTAIASRIGACRVCEHMELLPVFCSVLVFHFMRISESLGLHQTVVTLYMQHISSYRITAYDASFAAYAIGATAKIETAGDPRGACPAAARRTKSGGKRRRSILWQNPGFDSLSNADIFMADCGAPCNRGVDKAKGH